MSRKRIPKGRVQRKVFLDREALVFALHALKDDQHTVTTRGDMKEDWAVRYVTAEKHLNELIEASERA